MQTKIATCCYCGARTILKLSARDGHELACGSCGAPLHDMKWLKKPADAPAPHRAPPRKPAPAHVPREVEDRRRKSAKKRKKGKPIWKKAVEEAFDLIEDIFD